MRLPFAERIAALVGEDDGLAGVGHRVANRPSVISSSLRLPALMPRSSSPSAAHPSPAGRIGCSASVKTAEGAEANRGLVEQPGLVGFAEVRRDAAPRLLEERRHRRQVRPDRPELLRAVEAIVARAAQDAVDDRPYRTPPAVARRGSRG